MSTPAYFQSLSRALREMDRAIPYLVVDLDLLDRNITSLQEQLAGVPNLRLVVKSLPSIPLLEYLMAQLQTGRLMVFHQPFLLEIVAAFRQPLDILLGKPMPASTVTHFLQSAGEHPHRIQWLVDTPKRLKEYCQLARESGKKLRVNLEIDVGLHRGGFRDVVDLRQALAFIKDHSDQLEWTGFMGYDPQVVKLPALLGRPVQHLQRANNLYQQYMELVREEFPGLWHDELIFNGAGSLTFALHQKGTSPLNEVAVGSALLKPTTFDIPPLASFVPACWIATPVLKKRLGTRLPGLGLLPKWMSWMWPHLRYSYFIYGGYWKADYCYPPDIRLNQLFGPSTNQSMLNASGKCPLDVDDYVILRPWQSEFVLLQFGRILTYRAGAMHAEWSVLKG